MRWLRCTIRGSLGGGVEQFQHKVDLGKPGDDPDLSEAETLALAETLAGHWTTAFNNIAHEGGLYTHMSPEVRYEEVGVAQLQQHSSTSSDGTGGDLSQDYPTAWFMYPTASRPVGGVGTSLPYEVSCAVTLQTDKRGPSGRGRLYLPPFNTGQMATGGKFIAQAINSAGQTVGQFFDLVVDDTSLVPIVASSRRLVLSTITSINVGVIPDSQRRRRRSQDEARVDVWPT